MIRETLDPDRRTFGVMLAAEAWRCRSRSGQQRQPVESARVGVDAAALGAPGSASAHASPARSSSDGVRSTVVGRRPTKICHGRNQVFAGLAVHGPRRAAPRERHARQHHRRPRSRSRTRWCRSWSVGSSSSAASAGACICPRSARSPRMRSVPSSSTDRATDARAGSPRRSSVHDHHRLSEHHQAASTPPSSAPHQLHESDQPYDTSSVQACLCSSKSRMAFSPRECDAHDRGVRRSAAPCSPSACSAAAPHRACDG